MIIPPECHFVDDVSRPNDVLLITAPSGTRPAAAVWFAASHGHVRAARLECLTHVLGVMEKCRPEAEFWVIAGDQGTRPDDRIARYYGFWKGLTKVGKGPPGDHFECMHKVGNEIRFVGAAKFCASDVAWADAIIFSERAQALVAPKGEARNIVARLVNSGWKISRNDPPHEILSTAMNCGAILISVYGAFDDPEVTVAAIGKREALVGLCD